MNWTCLWNSFLRGETDAIQAIFSILGFIVAVIGTIFVVAAFRKQNEINREQRELNRLSMENDRRQIRPFFLFNHDPLFDEHSKEYYELTLTNATAIDVTVVSHSRSGAKDNVIVYDRMLLTDPPSTFRDVPFTIENNLSIIFSTLYFLDEYGRKYSQILFSQNLRVYSSIPLLLKPDFIFPDSTD